MSFSFGFGGEDIDIEVGEDASQPAAPQPPTSTTTPAPSAFPVPGKPQLPPTKHSLSSLLAGLPSKIAYGLLDIELDDESWRKIPRRELWDVRVQLMAEDDGNQGEVEGLGRHDVKTGVYEGGFKSWESSVDLVKVMADQASLFEKPLRVIELGCGTALPSLAIFQWAIESKARAQAPFSLILADYNPSVLQLVTLPNLILTWALSCASSAEQLQGAFTGDEELELTPEVLLAFQSFLSESQISLSFVSGAWSVELVDLLYDESETLLRQADDQSLTLVLGAETIYSPFALKAFLETVFEILQREAADPNKQAAALVGAKRLYFGVGGSLDDFIQGAKAKGGLVTELREETDGVRRGVVRCALRE